MSDQLALFIDFENVAIWAEQQFFDLELNRLMEYLHSRGPVIIKRAYGDWTRFSRYRDDLLSNSIDLIQMYSVRAAKNRADIRMALDAFEVVVNQPHINTIVIVSGDSDFGALASKLREYGKRVIGIGFREITHVLLVKSCDEFVYLETVLGQETVALEGTTSDRENARRLMVEALAAHEKRGDLPILGARLKQTMLSMDPTFNEENLGYGQFRAWLVDNNDLVNLFFRELQMYVAPVDFQIPREFTAAPKPEAKPTPTPLPVSSDQYRATFSRIVPVDVETRRDVLRDIYREMSEHPGAWTVETLLDELGSRYESKGLVRSKTLVRRVMQLGFHQRAYQYLGSVSVNTPFELMDDIDSQAAFILRAESHYVYTLVRAEVEIHQAEVAAVLLGDRNSANYVQELLDDLERRGAIERANGRYRLPGRGKMGMLDDPNLAVLAREMREIAIPDDLDRDVGTAKRLAKSGMAKRSQDFVGSAQDYLLAGRLQWEALERGDPEATLDDLRWYVASYASVKAGELSQVHHRFAEAQDYYLAFFSVVKEGTQLWNRMRGLINPMLSFYWRNLAREMGAPLTHTTLPSELATLMGSHSSPELRERWQSATEKLARVNPEVLRRVAGQIRLSQADTPHAIEVAGRIERMLESEEG